MKPTYNTIVLNHQDKLYMIGHKTSIIEFSFDECYQRTKRMSDWLELENTNIDTLYGTTELYQLFSELALLCKQKSETTNEICPCELIDELIGLENKQVEVIDKYGHKRKFYINRCASWMPIHLELKRPTDKMGIPVSGAPFQSLKILTDIDRNSSK